ncbi:pentapeptide repeat-containing protein [Anabaena variabilis FACHB-164]|nr:pentapeptide repeat-containing protein [Trichormus variabilis FACHB-164]
MSNDNNIDTLGNWLLAIGVIFILFVGGIFLGILNIECWTLKEKYEYGTKALTAIGTVFGGIAVFINAFFAAKRAYAMEETAKAANESAKAANKNAEAANKNAEAANEKQITERFAKAIEQLASEKIEVRLGAIYTLERIAKDSEKDQWTIMEVLTAFVRENAPIKKEEKSQKKKPLIDEFLNTQNKKEIEELPKLQLDIQECLTVIGRREHPDPENKRLDLSNVNISKANLKKAKLEKANFEGAKLEEVNLILAKLKGTIFIGASLQKAYLEQADLKGAFLSKANLEGATMPDGSIHD